MSLRTSIAGCITLLGLASAAWAEPTLVGFASLPPDTFEQDSHVSGQFIKEEELNGRTPPFHTQPIQGISSIVPSEEEGTFFAVSDNGYGSKANSADYLLSVYRVRPEFRTEEGGTGEVKVDIAFRLSDPNQHVPWPIVAGGKTYPNSDVPVPAEVRENRLLTGADFDPESMVRLPDGTFWIGDEFGPFLLHFDAEGRLLEPPVELPGEGMHSPDHPTKDPAKAKIERSAGFESLIYTPPFDVDYGVTGILEKPVADEEYLRVYVYAFQTDKGDQMKLPEQPFRYPLAGGVEAVSGASDGFAAVTIERDAEQANKAEVKQLAHFFLLGSANPGRGSPRVLLADLLNLPDPHALSGDGHDRFRFPFLTPESVLPVDEQTVLVVNDNNYPFTSGREQGTPDPTEFILIRFDKPLAELARDAAEGDEDDELELGGEDGDGSGLDIGN